VVAAPLVVLLAVLGACATGASDRSVPTTTRRLRVVATTMILGDVARTVAGDRADVTVLTGPTDDPSAFTLAPGPAAELTSADVILRIDPDYEQGLTAAIDQARAAGVAVYDATPAVAPMPGTDGRPDPHVWLDADRLTNVASQVGRLLATRSGTDPSPWQVGAAAFATTMTAADEAAQAVLNPVPDDRRTLVTTSDGLAYLAARYGFAIRPPAAGESALTVEVDRLTDTPPGPTTAAEMIIQTTAKIADRLRTAAPTTRS
jgi:zinc/manganese transport system substrate-binding protein